MTAITICQSNGRSVLFSAVVMRDNYKSKDKKVYI